MTTCIRIASALLCLQIALIAAAYLRPAVLSTTVPEGSYLKFSPAEITAIELRDAKNSRLLLQKKDRRWLMPDHQDLPADASQIGALLDKLAAQKAGFAVATSAGAATRFKVAKENAEQHLLLKQGEATAAELYVGSGAGFRRAHVRREGDEAVYSIELSSFELSPQADKWLDRKLLQLPEKEITALQLPALTVERSGEKWQLAGAPERSLDTAAVQKLISSACGPAVSGLASQELIDRQAQLAPILSWDCRRQDGGTVRYTIRQEKEQQAILHSSERPEFFTASPALVNELQQASPEQLLAKAAAADAEQDGASQPVAPQ